MLDSIKMRWKGIWSKAKVSLDYYTVEGKHLYCVRDGEMAVFIDGQNQWVIRGDLDTWENVVKVIKDDLPALEGIIEDARWREREGLELRNVYSVSKSRRNSRGGRTAPARG